MGREDEIKEPRLEACVRHNATSMRCVDGQTCTVSPFHDDDLVFFNFAFVQAFQVCD
jgi:hypothetical protein